MGGRRGSVGPGSETWWKRGMAVLMVQGPPMCCLLQFNISQDDDRIMQSACRIRNIEEYNVCLEISLKWA